VKTLAERLKHARDLRGLTQAELASRAGVKQTTIGNAEAGTRKQLQSLVAIARALDVDPDWLFDGNGPAPVVEAREPSANYRTTRWLFSAELFLALSSKPDDDLRRIENAVRGLLDLPALATIPGKSKAA